MDNREARLLLQAYRPGSTDEMDPAFTEAFELAARDPELQAWWEAQQAFDRAVSARLADVPVPDDLRDSIFAARRKVVPMPAQPPRVLGWLAAAAVVGILCVAGTMLQLAKHGPVEQTAYTKAALAFVEGNGPDLALLSPDHDKIMAWLKEQDAPMGTLPGKMASLPTVGCQKFTVHGHAVTLICFAMQDGRIAHLFIVDEDALEDPPDTAKPDVRDNYGWRTAQWSDGRMSYLLVTQDDENALRQLL